MPEYLAHPEGGLLGMVHLWLLSKPFLKLTEAERAEVSSFSAQESDYQPVRVITTPHETMWRYRVLQDPRRVAEMEKEGFTLLLLDRRFGKGPLKSAAMRKIDALDYAGLKMRTSAKGKAAQSKLFMLKELAAYRLKTFGHMTREEAQSFLKDRYEERHLPRTKVKHVWPLYSAGGWSKAIEAVDMRFKNWFPMPSLYLH